MLLRCVRKRVSFSSIIFVILWRSFYGSFELRDGSALQQKIFSGRTLSSASTQCRVLAGELGKCLRHHSVHIAPKWYDEVGDTIEALPAPGIEFGRLAVARRQRVDFIVAAGVAQREPFLPLPAELREAMRGRSVIGRKVIFYPIGLAEIFGADRAGLLPEFAHDGIARVL